MKFRLAGESDCLVDIVNTDAITDLKQKYISKSGKDVAVEQVRLFCMGKELKNENFVYSYDINQDKVITVLIRKA